MRVRRQVDSTRGVVRITIEHPLTMDPEQAADRAWEATEREMIRVQARDTEGTSTVLTTAP